MMFWQPAPGSKRGKPQLSLTGALYERYPPPCGKEKQVEWREVIEHPSLRDLPFKIETNEWGEIVMTPATVGQSKYQAHVIKWFDRFATGGDVLPECPIQTCEGVKVADVAWGTTEFFSRNTGDMPSLPECPEIVVEVRSPSNTCEEMERKRKLYFEKGAKEVWFCDKEGDMHFFAAEGKLERSLLFKQFPEHIDIDAV